MIKKELWPKLGSTAVGAFGFAGTAIGLFTVQGKIELPLRLVIVVGIITFVLICVAVSTIILTNHWAERGVRYPILAIKQSKDDSGNPITLLYTEFTETLPMYSLATINHETQKLGLALVTNYSPRSDHNIVELQVKYVRPSHAEIYKEACLERKTVLEKISISPAVREEDYELYLSSKNGGDGK